MPDIGSQLKVLETRSFKTYQCRLRACQRLAARNKAWNAFLISVTTASTIASVALLTKPDMYGTAGPTVLVVAAVMTLVASLVTSGLDYSGRSRNMFLNYRKVQRISTEAERVGLDPSLQTMAVLKDLTDQYNALLDESENHTAADYYHATPDAQITWAVVREAAISWLPYASLLIPVALLIPLVNWVAKSVSGP